MLYYRELVEWRGRIIREDTRSGILAQHPLLLFEISFYGEVWLTLASSFGKEYQGVIGYLEALLSQCHNVTMWGDFYFDG